MGVPFINFIDYAVNDLLVLYNVYNPTNATKFTTDLLYFDKSIDIYGIDGTDFHND